MIDLGDKAVRVSRTTIDSDTLGDCDNGKPIGDIRVSKDLSGRLLLDTELHELFHHLMPYLDEDHVRKLGTQAAEYLIQRGFIRKDWL